MCTAAITETIKTLFKMLLYQELQSLVCSNLLNVTHESKLDIFVICFVDQTKQANSMQPPELWNIKRPVSLLSGKSGANYFRNYCFTLI